MNSKGVAGCSKRIMGKKHKISLLLIASMAICLIICPVEAYAEDTSSIWEIGNYLDVFNQPTGQYFIGTSNNAVGTFNNSTVTNGPLEAEIRVDGSQVSIALYEYGNQKVKNGGRSDIVFPILVRRADGSTFSVNGVMKSGADCITVSENQVDCILIGSSTEQARSTSIAVALCSETGAVSFYITRADQPASNYLFSVECGNFAKLYDEALASVVLELAYFSAEDFLRNNQLQEALNMFTSLGSYSDSPERAKAVVDLINAGLESKYQAAEALLDEGKLGLAAISFWNIGDYKDAHDRSLELWSKVTDRKTVVAGGWHTVAVKKNGTVVAVGSGSDGQKRVSGWSNIVAVDAYFWNTVGLKTDGTVVAVGMNEGQCNVSKWKDIVAIASGYWGTLGLKADGTVVVAEMSGTGFRKEIEKWPTNIVSISAGKLFAGLTASGTVVVATDADTAQIDKKVAEWSDIVAISSGYSHIVGLKADGTVVAAGKNGDGQCDVSDWTDIVAVSAGCDYTVGLKSDGTVVAVGYNRDGQCNVSKWTDIVAISVGAQHTIGLKSDGTVVAAGFNGEGDGQCNVGSWQDIMLPAK